MKKQNIIGLLCTFTAAVAFGADDATVRYDVDRNDDHMTIIERDRNRDWIAYKANELDFSFFGTAVVGQETLRHPSTRRVERNSRLGVGAGLSYFFCRYIGVEGYASSESTAHRFVDHVGGDLVGRFPILNSGVAPYVFGGGARQTDPLYQWSFDAGGGIEWRFVSHVGIFLDARYVWADKTKDYGMGRLGVKVGF